MRRIKFGWRLLLVAAVPLFLGMAGCTGKKDVSFRHVASNGRPTPGVEFVTDSQAFDQLWEDLFAPGEKPAVNWDKEAVIGVFLGEKPTGGYGVIVNKVVLEKPDHLQLTASLRQPGPDDFVTMAITYPGHLVAIEREHLRIDNVRRVTVVDEDEVVLFDSGQSEDSH